MEKIKVINRHLLDDLVTSAKNNPRLRQHQNLHNDFSDPSQRIVVAMEPETYVQPHRHSINPKPECFICLRGSLALLIFDDSGEVSQVYQLGPDQDNLCIDIPAGVWHTVISLETGSILFETKPGPYTPLEEAEFATWAPNHDSELVHSYLCKLKELVLNK